MFTLDQYFQQFLRERVYLHNITPATQEYYETAWKAFRRSQAEEAPKIEGAPLFARSDLQDFVIHLRERGVKPVSCNCWLRGLNAFGKWLHTEGAIPQPVRLPPLKLEKRLLAVHDEKTLRRILGYKPKSFIQWRVYAVACTILDTGCRIDELLTARTVDFDFDNMLLTVVGKGRKQRKVPFSIELRKTLFRFGQVKEGTGVKSELMFPARAGYKWEHRNARRSYGCVLKGLELPPTGFHLLRHTMATLHLALQPVDLVAVAQAALDVVRPLAVTKDVHLVLSPDLQAIETVSGDAGRLKQVILNLLANAIKFTPEGGRVAVFIEPSKDHMEVRVVDTGQGISPNFLPHVFERFRQADGTTTRRNTGLGLGLAIVRQIVELHGGTVHAASEGVGRGSTFTVRLPMAAGGAHLGHAAALDERRTAAQAVSPMPRGPRLDALRILVVDDSADGRTLTSLVLTQAGASVTAVASAREALEMLKAERPDALVSDIGLPDEDGYGLIRQIRRDEAEHGGFLPAVALTGFARADDRARILAAGFQAHVPKPIDPVELTAAIATMTHHLQDSEP